VLHLLAIVALCFAVVFFAFTIVHGIWAWQLFMLIGLALWCISGHPWVHDHVN
jgi:hypothetical protein